MSELAAHLAHEADIAPAAALMADHARAAMLLALLDGRPLAATELARLAAVSPPTASPGPPAGSRNRRWQPG